MIKRLLLLGPALRTTELVDEIPLMVLDGTAPRVPAGAPPGCRIRPMPAREADLHATVAAGGFEAPVEHFRQMLPPSLLAAPGIRAYLAELDGAGVATGLGCRLDDFVGAFNIATLPAYRRRGLGAAVPADRRRRPCGGAGWAWLQSSATGYRLYERLGFVTVERWDCWVSAA